MLVYPRVNPMNTGNGGFLSHGSTPKSSKSSIYRWIFHNKPSSELGVPPFMEPPYILLYHVVHQPLVNSPKYQIYIHLPNINIVFHGWVNISGWWIWNMFFPYIGNNIFQRGWNHQPDLLYDVISPQPLVQSPVVMCPPCHVALEFPTKPERSSGWEAHTFSKLLSK